MDSPRKRLPGSPRVQDQAFSALWVVQLMVQRSMDPENCQFRPMHNKSSLTHLSLNNYILELNYIFTPGIWAKFFDLKTRGWVKIQRATLLEAQCPRFQISHGCSLLSANPAHQPSKIRTGLTQKSNLSFSFTLWSIFAMTALLTFPHPCLWQFPRIHDQ